MCAWCINTVVKVNEYCFVASQFCCPNYVPLFNCESYVSEIFKLCTFATNLCTFTPPNIINQLCLTGQLCLNAKIILPTLTITFHLHLHNHFTSNCCQLGAFITNSNNLLKRMRFEYNFEP